MSPRAARLMAEIEQLRGQATRAEKEASRLSTALARSACRSLQCLAACCPQSHPCQPEVGFELSNRHGYGCGCIRGRHSSARSACT